MLLKIKAGIILGFSINKIEYPVALDNHCPRLCLVLTTKVKNSFLIDKLMQRLYSNTLTNDSKRLLKWLYYQPE